jgi:Flp pilus assembly protein TadG
MIRPNVLNRISARKLKRNPANVGARLRHSQSGVAAIEFALVTPVILGMFLAGAELTNYAITRMRISQIALHVADNASRIGTNSLLTAPQISELQINDLFVGANMQAETLDLQGRGRIILSSIEPVADPNTTKKFKIHWQRCFGQKAAMPSYGTPAGQPQDAFGPPNRQVKAPERGGVMFVEVAYEYKPLLSASLVPNVEIVDTAAMTVRDDRYYDGNNGTGIYNNENVTVHTCVT